MVWKIGERTQQIEVVRSGSRRESTVPVEQKSESGDVVDLTCLQ